MSNSNQQNQNQQNQNKPGTQAQGQQGSQGKDEAQGQRKPQQARDDDMSNTGAQAKANQPQTADKDVQQRKEAPKQDQNH